ncbi:hypothetical protein [Streptomyces sp. SM11]|uniref:hypothetical protein n=1 Tax=Streptomyces sp. SM11 TaxID=565557 RepID=UPI000CD4A62A|nr:hypothetical protein [Streptomyces sp. SM11]
MSAEPARMKPPIYGYIRALPELDPEELLMTSGQLLRWAWDNHFHLAEVFVERRWLHTTAWDELVGSCNRHGVRDVVVPDYRHLHSLPALSHVMQSVIEDVIQGRVWCARPDRDVPECQPLDICGGETT